MNRVISDTAEYACYLFDHAAKPLLSDFMKNADRDIIGDIYSEHGLWEYAKDCVNRNQVGLLY